MAPSTDPGTDPSEDSEESAPILGLIAFGELPEGYAQERNQIATTSTGSGVQGQQTVVLRGPRGLVTIEAERRGRRPPSPAKEKPVADAKPQRRQEAVKDGADSLTTGKLNAVRAAFKAGVKPSAIARQFGISQSDVRKALAQGTRREA